jgi:hypothetical protein
MNRVLGAARLYATRPQGSLLIPWMVVLSAFAVNVAIWGFGDLADEPEASTGGLSALYIAMTIFFVQAVVQLFPFGMSLGLSRRTFIAGTALVALVQAVGYGVALTGLTAVEDATGGWGVGLNFFGPYGLNGLNVVQQFVVYGSLMLACQFLGMTIGAVAKRWGATGLWILGIAALLVFGGAAVLITGMHSWTDLGHWLAARSALTLTLVLAGAVAVLSGGLSYAGLRRAVP